METIAKVPTSPGLTWMAQNMQPVWWNTYDEIQFIYSEWPQRLRPFGEQTLNQTLQNEELLSSLNKIRIPYIEGFPMCATAPTP